MKLLKIFLDVFEFSDVYTRLILFLYNLSVYVCAHVYVYIRICV